MRSAEFNIVSIDNDRIVIRDVGHHNGITVTNDIENVVKRCKKLNYLKQGQRFLYYDSDNCLSEIEVENGKFVRFI